MFSYSGELQVLPSIFTFGVRSDLIFEKKLFKTFLLNYCINFWTPEAGVIKLLGKIVGKGYKITRLLHKCHFIVLSWLNVNKCLTASSLLIFSMENYFKYKQGDFFL